MHLVISAGGSPSRSRMVATLERWDTSGDRRAVFLHHWAQTTDGLLQAVRNDRFGDSLWVLQLVEQLSAYYFITVEPEGDDLTLVTPPAWQVAHDTTLTALLPQPSTVLLGYNAVITNDLPQAVCDMLFDAWPLTGVRLERRYQDFRIAGDIITSRFSDDAAAVATWIDDVWGHALALVTAADNAWRDIIRAEIEDGALRRAHLIVCDIEHREHLLRLPSARLDQLFPARHEGNDCRLRVKVPTWGAATASAL